MSDNGLVLLRLDREDQIVSSTNNRRFMQEPSKPSDSISSAIPEPFLTLGFSSCKVLASSSVKKLRLTKQQSALLEDSFNEHITLNPQQKLTLAKHLNLRPRQVEVWFQNRRARTKLKKTEVDCELLRQYCETLTAENRRLHRELQKLRSLKLAVAATPMYLKVSPATLMLCPSCERAAVREADDVNR